jgi:HlyD family secretion protein
MSGQAAPEGATKIFRQASLDRLSSPEQLDRVITVTKPHDWLAAVALSALLAAAVIWSVFGSVPTLVKGSGILIATGGQVFDAITAGDGIVTEIVPKVGDTVAADDVIARISQTTLVLQIKNARAVLAERKNEYDGRRKQADSYKESRLQNLAARRRALDDRVASSERHASAVEKQLQSEERMFEQRLITWDKLQGTRQDLAMAHQTALDAKSQIVQVEADEISARHSDERELQAALERLTDAERQLSELELQLQQRDQVLSPAAGRVTELKVAVGNRIPAGTPIASIESGVTGLQLVLYLPPDQGKLVKPGMDVRVSPSTVKREEYGTVVGTVREVSEFPATAQAMGAVLGNESLVRQFSSRGPPFATRIDLSRDPRTTTGYQWSGGSGPPTVISSGTIADAEVTVREDAPISFVVPLLRKATGQDR